MCPWASGLLSVVEARNDNAPTEAEARRGEARLYEQERGKPESFPRLGVYVRRWLGWARSPSIPAA